MKRLIFLINNYIPLQALAEIVKQEDLDKGNLYPPLKDIRECSVKIAKSVVEHAYKTSAFYFS